MDPLADDDGDGMSNFNEYRTGTDPRDGGSCLRMVGSVTPMGSTGLVVRWASAEGATYSLARGTNLTASGFQNLATNLMAAPPFNTYIDAGATGRCYYYRVKVR